jgi:quercetin dioxygenase-like cupin family protein
MEKMEFKNISVPDEVRTLPKTKIEVVNHTGISIMRVTFEPGWSWAECVAPSAGTKSCEVPHINYVISGKLAIKMDDGTETVIGPGGTAVIPPGHNAWVVGNEPCVAIDFAGAKIYGK